MPSKPEADTPSEDLPHVRAAVWLGGAFLISLLAVSIFTVADFASGANREAFSETTAAGDVNYFRALENVEPSFSWKGRQYTLSSREKVKIDDTDMVRMGREDTGGFTIYSRRSEPGKELFVKIDVGEFLPLRTR
jgi:hypothetical protein